MFRHNPCFKEVAMSLYSIYPFAVFAFQHSRAPYRLHKWLRICSLGLRIRPFSFALYNYYNYIWDFRASCVSERTTVFRNDFLRCLYSVKHRSCDTAYLLNKMNNGSFRRSQGSLWSNIDPVSCSLGYRAIKDLNPLFNNLSDRDSYMLNANSFVYYTNDISSFRSSNFSI